MNHNHVYDFKFCVGGLKIDYFDDWSFLIDKELDKIYEHPNRIVSWMDLCCISAITNISGCYY